LSKRDSSQKIEVAGFASGVETPIDSRLTVSSTAGLQVVTAPSMVPHEFSTNLNGLNIAEFMGGFLRLETYRFGAS
jgi:hypothetical protein